MHPSLRIYHIASTQSALTHIHERGDDGGAGQHSPVGPCGTVVKV